MNPLHSPGSVTQVVTQHPRPRGWRGKLSDEQVRRGAKPADKPYAIADGHGLHLVVRPNGRKVWFLTYRIADGRQRKITLGEYPAVTLAAARSLAASRLGEVAKGQDPAGERRKAKVAAKEAAET